MRTHNRSGQTSAKLPKMFGFDSQSILDKWSNLKHTFNFQETSRISISLCDYDDDLMTSTALTLVCDLLKYGCIGDPCGQTFSGDDELRVHAHLGNGACTRERYSTPCPWEACISHESKQ